MLRVFTVARTTAEEPNWEPASRQAKRETTGKNRKAALEGGVVGDRLKKKSGNAALCLGGLLNTKWGL